VLTYESPSSVQGECRVYTMVLHMGRLLKLSSPLTATAQSITQHPATPPLQRHAGRRPEGLDLVQGDTVHRDGSARRGASPPREGQLHLPAGPPNSHAGTACSADQAGLRGSCAQGRSDTDFYTTCLQEDHPLPKMTQHRAAYTQWSSLEGPSANQEQQSSKPEAAAQHRRCFHQQRTIKLVLFSCQN